MDPWTIVGWLVAIVLIPAGIVGFVTVLAFFVQVFSEIGDARRRRNAIRKRREGMR